MKTPEQIAAMYAQFVYAAAHECHVTDVTGNAPGLDATGRAVLAAIEADRAQRDIIARVAEVLDDRGAHAAARLVRDTDPDDDLWNNYIGPMIDSIEDDYTGMAKEINA